MNISDREFVNKFAQTLKAVKVSQAQQPALLEEGETEGESERPYVFILNRQSGGIKAYYLSLHPHKGYLLPHIQSVTWTKLKGWVDYGSVVCNNSLYVMGGKEKDNHKYTSKMMRYDPAEDRWIQLSNMKRPKAHFSLTVVGKRILVTGLGYFSWKKGGEASDGEILDIIESYHPNTDSWTIEGRLPEPRKNHSVTTVNSRLFFCGGQGPTSAFNNNLWELRREVKFVGEKENIIHQWYNDWNPCFTRKTQQATLFSARNKLFCVGGMVQGPTEDGRKLADEEDIDEPNSDDEAIEEAKRQREREPYVPTYIRMLEEETKQKKRGPKTLTRTTRRCVSIDVGNNYLRYKNPYKAMVTERRMIQSRSGAATLTLGNRVYLLGGFKLEEEKPYIPRVEYYHIKKKRWFSVFNLSTYDEESFRDINVHLLKIPTRNTNFKLLTASYKYPCW